MRGLSGFDTGEQAQICTMIEQTRGSAERRAAMLELLRQGMNHRKYARRDFERMNGYKRVRAAIAVLRATREVAP